MLAPLYTAALLTGIVIHAAPHGLPSSDREQQPLDAIVRREFVDWRVLEAIARARVRIDMPDDSS